MTESTTSAARNASPARTRFAALLRDWRRRRRLSQQTLALDAGVSQRHLSFLESGRSQPSREMILKLCESLDVPLRERNPWLVAAGFAPLYRARGLDDPQMAQVSRAVTLMLDNHSPYPALAMDRRWQLYRANRPFMQMLALLTGNSLSEADPAAINLLELFFSPGGIRPLVSNWDAIAPLLWRRAEREAEELQDLTMRSTLATLGRSLDVAGLRRDADAPLVPVLPLTLAVGGLELSLFTVISTFGTAQDVHAEELRIECFFPADEATERWLKAELH
ncbi:MAG: helix-turn-helix transcriptional regulator [Pseudomonadota bacterium]